jgi:hypothetical protein
VSTCLITWDGPCEEHGRWHACCRSAHTGRHKCACGSTSLAFRNPKPEREPVPRVYQRLAPRTRPYTRREPSYYWPEYLKRKRGIT